MISCRLPAWFSRRIWRPELHAPISAPSGSVPLHAFRGNYFPSGNLSACSPLNRIRRAAIGVHSVLALGAREPLHIAVLPGGVAAHVAGVLGGSPLQYGCPAATMYGAVPCPTNPPAQAALVPPSQYRMVCWLAWSVLHTTVGLVVPRHACNHTCLTRCRGFHVPPVMTVQPAEWILIVVPHPTV